MERMYNEEFTEANADAERGLSIEDRRARKIMDQSATLVNGHYQLKLPFRKDPPNLPDSLAVAERRLKWLKAKFQKNPVFQSQYSSVLEKYQKEDPQDKYPIVKCQTWSQSGIFLIMQYGTQENQKNPEWCLTVLPWVMERHWLNSF